MKNLSELSDLTIKVVKYYYGIANENYSDISAFSIVTDESLSTFSIAININKFIEDVISERISDEDYWNTAEWVEETLDFKFQNQDIERINELLNDEEISEDFFLEICFHALKQIRNKYNQNICLLVSITDTGFSERLYEIVSTLNTELISKSYQEYFKVI